MSYLSRSVDPAFEDAVNSSGAVVLRGARAVGKTETAKQLAKSVLYLDSSDPLAMLARQQPSVALAGESPRLLDEWQLVPQLWNDVRHRVDEVKRPGQFILSGSVAPLEDSFRHSGAGRFRQILMRTMTLQESGESTGEVSLAGLLRGEVPAVAQSPVGFGQVIQRIVTGGWPGWLDAPPDVAAAQAMSYVEDIVQHDFSQVAGTRRDPRRFMGYLRAMAAVTAQPTTYAALSRRMEDVSGQSVGAAAVPQLHDLAARLYLSEDQPGWSPRLRSRTAATQTPKRHLADPSLSAALLGAGPERLLMEPETLGFLFESQVTHDVRVYAQAAGARGVFYYRDTKGRDEIDVVVEGPTGEWLALEVKLGSEAVDAAAQNLVRVTNKMVRPPVANVVVTPTGIAHQRADGVLVVPLTTLGV